MSMNKLTTCIQTVILPCLTNPNSTFHLITCYHTSRTAEGARASFKERNGMGKVELLERRWRSDRWFEC